jgi:hypothetical protein
MGCQLGERISGDQHLVHANATIKGLQVAIMGINDKYESALINITIPCSRSSG